MKQKEISWQEQYRYLILLFTEQTKINDINLTLLFEHNAYQIIVNQELSKQFLSPLYQFENTINCFLDFLKAETEVQKIEYITKDQGQQGEIIIHGMAVNHSYGISLLARPKMLKQTFELYQSLQLHQSPKVKNKKHVYNTTFIMK